MIVTEATNDQVNGVTSPEATELRCHSCSHAVGSAPREMRLAALFNPRLVGRVPRTHAHEIRRRCRSCCWINVFHPTPGEPHRVGAIEVKG